MASGTDRINKILSNAGTVTTSGTPTNTGAARIDSILRNVGKVSVDETAFKTLSQPRPPKVLDDVEKTKLQFAVAGMPMPTQNDINRLYKDIDELKRLRDTQYWDKKTVDNSDFYNKKISEKEQQIEELAKIVPNAQLRSKTPILNFAARALTDFADSAATTLLKSPLAPSYSLRNLTRALTGMDVYDAYDPIFEGLRSDREWATRRIEGDKASRGKGFDIAGTLVEGTVGALPQAALAIATGGTSAVSALPALGGNAGLGTAITNSLSKMLQSPTFVASFSQSYGSSFNQAIASGASEDQATLTAMLVGLINSGVELTGGIETLPGKLQSGNVSAVREWVSSMLDEGKEEVVQGVIERLTNKMVYDTDKPLASMTDPNAVFNPVTSAQEGVMGAAIGGILSGGQVMAVRLLSNSSNKSVANRATDILERLNSTDTKVASQAQVDAMVFLHDVSYMESVVQELETKLSEQPQTPDTVSAQDTLDRRRQIQQRNYASAREILSQMTAENQIITMANDYLTSGTLQQMEQIGAMTQEISALKKAYGKAFQIQQRIAWLRENNGNPAEIKDAERALTKAAATLKEAQDDVSDYLKDKGVPTPKSETQPQNQMLSTGLAQTPAVTPQNAAQATMGEQGMQTPTQANNASQANMSGDISTPYSVGAPSIVDDLGAAKGGLYRTNQWSAPDKYAVNTNRNPDLYNLPTEKAQVVLESPKSQKTLKDRWNSFYKHVVDNQHGASRFDKVAGSNVSMWMSNARSANGIVNNALNGELRDFDGNLLGGSLHSVLSQIPKAEMKDFFTYAYHSHNINRAVMGNNIFTEFNKEQSAQKVKEAEAAHPEWQKYRDDIVNWIATFSKAWSVDTGLVSEDIYNNNRVMYPNYIPSHRVFEEIEKAMTGGSIGDKFVDVSSQMHKATGSDRNMNPLVNIANLVHKTINAAAYNKVGQEIYKAIEANPEKMAEFGEIVSEGSTLSNVVSVLIDGQRKYMKLNDADLLEALNGLPKATKAWPFVSKLTAAFKGLITQYNILFGIKNLMRDIPTGYAYGSEGNPFKYLKGEAKALKEIITNGEMYRLYKSVGGGMSNYINKSALEKFAYGLAKQQSGVKAAASKVVGGIEAYNAAIETMTRLNEFMTVYNKTGDPHRALDASNNVTVNFARGGDLIKTLDKNGAAYLNASVQGLDKFVRSFSSPRAAVTMLARAGLSVTLPTLVLYLINMNNPHYDDEEDRIKDAYYLIPNVLGPKDAEGYCETFIRIPKGREFGALFGALFERILRWSGGENADSAFKSIGTTVGTNFAPNNPLTDNLFTPVIRDLKSNKDFAGRTIVPQSLQKLSPHLQYDEKTSELSKFISDMVYKTVGAEWSPKVMDFLVDSYTGIVGDILLPATTKGGNPLSPFTRAFVTDSVYNNQTLTNFYDNMDKAARVAADKNLLYDIPSEEVTREEKISNMYSKANTQISTLSKISARAGVGALTQDDTDALKALGIDTTLKVAELQREIKKAQIDIAKSAIARAETGGDMELDLFNNSNIKDMVDKYTKSGLTQAQSYELYNSFKTLKPLPGKKSVSDIQKYELIVNSKLNRSDMLKALSVAMGDTKTYSNMMIAVKAGITPKKYIEIYSATNNMKSDKDADGKDIKGQTKQDKVWNYIDKLNLSVDQKNALHYAMGYAESSLYNAPWNKK